MPNISFDTQGSFSNTERFFSRMSRGEIFNALSSYAQEGVDALRSATPVDTGATAAAWSYKVERSKGSYAIHWTNSHFAGTAPLVIMLQYGHGTGTGGYVKGRDFINPAIRPVFDRIADKVWKVVTSA